MMMMMTVMMMVIQFSADVQTRVTSEFVRVRSLLSLW